MADGSSNLSKVESEPSPSLSPTDYVQPSWSWCPDSRPYFTFISNTQNNAITNVYWPLPTLNDHLYPINMTVIPDIMPGDDVNVGMHIITYFATDFMHDTEIERYVTIFVIGGSSCKSSYKYCKKEKFHINLRFNDSYYELADDEAMGSWDGGVIFEGTKGKLMCDCYAANPRLLPASRMEEFEEPAPTLKRMTQENHQRNWVEAIKGNAQCTSSFDYAGPFTEIVLLGNLAIRSLYTTEERVDGNNKYQAYTGEGKKLAWDAEAMRITN